MRRFSSRQATQNVQQEILKSTTHVEGSILKAVEITSGSLHEDIQLLADQLATINIDSVQQTVSQFTVSHRDLLERLSNQLDSIVASQANSRDLTGDTRLAAARQRILESLYFPQIYERQDHILQAHHGTYGWIFESGSGRRLSGDSFVSWLKGSPGTGQIYWVSGKVGSGKSTLLHYIDGHRDLFQHAHPWAEAATVVKASYYFWNAGVKFQKSMGGLLRTLLTQLFEQTPDLVPTVVHSRTWQRALIGGNHLIDWTESELKGCLHQYILLVRRLRQVFLLIDGLDEIEGGDEALERMLDFLNSLAANENVKLCLSSRPWNIFQDAFYSCPQLNLQDLTYDDVSIYVHDQLNSNQRFRRLAQYEQAAAGYLVNRLINKAAGVFLWARLVVKELLSGLRDGDNIRTLLQKVEEVPADLNTYYMRLLESIEPRNREEASKFFQLALYDEQDFTSLHSNYLLDLIFIEEGKPDFALEPLYNFSQFDLANKDAVALRLESTARKLNSRCMGLLEWYNDGEYVPRLQSFGDDSCEVESVDLDNLEPMGKRHGYWKPFDSPELLEDADIVAAAHLTVDFLHRSLRDFFLTPAVQKLLHQYTRGPYNARMFYRNARLVQLVALNRIEAGFPIAVGLASYIFSTLAVHDYRNSAGAAQMTALMRPVIENMVRYEESDQSSGWYVTDVLNTWRSEGSTFLTLAIDFGLESYIRAHMTPQIVQSKTGRPILDYLLRSRFIPIAWEECLGNRFPHLEFLHVVLESGADPNEKYQGVSIWAFFLCYVADYFGLQDIHSQSMESSMYLGALTMMVQKGAHVLIPERWLMSEFWPGQYGLNNPHLFLESSDERIERRFPDKKPAIERKHRDIHSEPLYAVSDLLECFRYHFGSNLDSLKTMVMHREAEELKLITKAV